MIATWNINSFNVRQPHVLDWLTDNPVDFLCLQELKMAHDKVDPSALEAMGYHVAWSGQPTYNGVATISRNPGHDIIRNNPYFEDKQQRLIATTHETTDGPVRIICAYCPNGSEVGSDKYQYKLAWFEALTQFIKEQLQQYPRLVLTGDFNIAPDDRDVHEDYKGEILISPPERAALQALIDLGLHDAFRLFEQEDKSFSWWDYRRLGFQRNAGLRIDLVLLSDALKGYCTGCHIDKTPRRWERPSDHTPVVATMDWTLVLD